MDKYLFITDFDGTLLNDEKRISQRDLHTLDRLREAGTATAIATGRSHFSFFRALSQMQLDPGDLPVDYLIFSTGAGIMDLASGEVIRQCALNRGDVGRICDCFDARGFDYMIHRAIPHTRQFLYRDNSGKGVDFHHRISMYKDYGRPLGADTPVYEAVTEVLAVVQDGLPPEMVAELQDQLSDFSVIHATSPLDHRSSWIEVFHPRVSKSLSSEWLIQRIGVDRSRVISVGNDYNDVDLLEWSGRGFMVANAPSSLGAAFEQVGSNNEGGVTQAAQVAGLLP